MDFLEMIDAVAKEFGFILKGEVYVWRGNA